MISSADFCLRNVCVAGPGELQPSASVWVRNGRIDSVTIEEPCRAGGSLRNDCSGQYLLPGFIDLHTHGALGADVMMRSPQSLRDYLVFQARWGVTTTLPTTTAAPSAEIDSFLSFLKKMQSERLPGAKIAGAHLEGPYLNPALRGMHPEEHCRAFAESEYESWIQGGIVRRITAALELPEGERFLRRCEESGILVSLGHTACSADDVQRWAKQGLRHITHLYNAMSRAEKRGPVRTCGCLEGALLADEVTCEVIADGNHVPAELFRLALRTKGAERITICSDSTPATGIASEGCETVYGGIESNRMTVREGRAVSLDGQTLVGSICPLGAMLPLLLEWTDGDWVGVAQMLSSNAARLLRLEDNLGRVAAGYAADMVLVNGTGHVLRTWVNGVEYLPAS